jgi:hypothetical protein
MRSEIERLLQGVYSDGHKDGTKTSVSADGTSSTQVYVSPQYNATEALLALFEKMCNEVIESVIWGEGDFESCKAAQRQALKTKLGE